MSGASRNGSAQRHRPRARLSACLASVAVIALLVTGCGIGSRAYQPAAGGPVVSTFKVPTYAWDKGSGMDALVSGTLWFTAEGCTLLSSGKGRDRVTQAVFFPNATGVTYDNGVRAVVDPDGSVFAVEGQEFAYGGGFGVRADSDLGKQWLDQCPGTDVREGAMNNTFDPQSFATMTIDGYDYTDGTFTAYYTLRGTDDVSFAEVVDFSSALADRRPDDRLLGLLALTCSLSYYKAAAPPRIDIAFPTAESEQRYLRELITGGLGEFAYRNSLPGAANRISVMTPCALRKRTVNFPFCVGNRSAMLLLSTTKTR